MGLADDKTLDQHAGRRFLLAGCFVALLFALVWSRSRPPRARGSDAPASEFSAARALGLLRDWIGDGAPRPGGTAAHARVRQHIVERFRELGFDTQVQETLARGPAGRVAIVRNIVARTTTGSGPRVLLCAHYDSVGAGPGAGDDASGVACLLESARALGASAQRARPIVFLVTDAEEAGLIGAAAFVEQHPWAAEVGVVINLEARGTSGPSMMFETSGENAWLIDALADSLPRPWTTSVAELVYKNMPNDTDLSVFRRRGIPGVNFAFIGGLWHYHTPLDDLAHLDPDSVQHQGDNALSLARELADRAPPGTGTGNVVFADVAGIVVVRWPVSWSLPLALIGLVLSTLAAWRVRAQGGIRAQDLVACVAGCLALTILVSGSCALLVAAINAVRGVPDAALAHPWPMRLVLFTVVATSVLLVGRSRFVVRTGFAGVHLAAGLLCNVAACAAAILVPETSYLLVLPGCAAGAVACCLAARRERPAPRPSDWLALLPLGVTLMLWLPIAIAFELGFHLALGAVLGGPLAFIGVAGLPWIVELPKRKARLAAMALLCSLTASVVAALCVPIHSADRPAWLNLRYIDDSERRAARWEASTFGLGLPEALRAEADFQPAHEPPFPWLTLDPSLFAAPAPKWPVPYPELIVASNHTTAEGRVVRCRARSARGAGRLHLHLPDEVEIRAIAWRGQVIQGGFERVRTQLVFAVEPDGVDFELLIRSREPVDVWLLDQDWRWPDFGTALRDARPDSAVPRSDGDVSILGRRITLD